MIRRGECVSIPLQAARRAQHDAHEVPHAGGSVAEGVQATFRLVGVVRERGKDDAGRADDQRDDVRLDCADAYRACRLIAATADDRRSGFQPSEFGGFGADDAVISGPSARRGIHDSGISSVSSTSLDQRRLATSNSDVPEASETSMT